MDPKPQALEILCVELLEVVLLLGNLNKHIEALPNNVLLGHTQYLLSLRSFPRDVQRKILPIHDALDKIQPLWNELIHDENVTDDNSMLLRFFLVSNKSNGARRGTKNNARNSSWPSTLECFTDK